MTTEEALEYLRVRVQTRKMLAMRLGREITADALSEVLKEIEELSFELGDCQALYRRKHEARNDENSEQKSDPAPSGERGAFASST